ncbi:MAG: Nif11-like leader peptide family RiPP precursor, partial [Cyanobacteriota bacterium]
MSEEQVAALLARLQEDADLREKVQDATDLYAADALVQEAGFVVSNADWLKYQEQQSSELSDAELELVAGARIYTSRHS